MPKDILNIVHSYRNLLRNNGVLHQIAQYGVCKEINELRNPFSTYWKRERGCLDTWYVDEGVWYEDHPDYEIAEELGEPFQRLLEPEEYRPLIPVIVCASKSIERMRDKRRVPWRS